MLRASFIDLALKGKVSATCQKVASEEQPSPRVERGVRPPQDMVHQSSGALSLSESRRDETSSAISYHGLGSIGAGALEPSLNGTDELV
jgi:hypothetical protein